MSKSSQREYAISLRKQGKSYSEILAELPVAKSTLSLWLRSVGLSTPQKQVLTERRLAAAKRGGAAKRVQRLANIETVFTQCRNDIGAVSKRDLFILGIALYWAEGSKEKEGKRGSGVRFTNMDPQMLIMFLRWLKELGVFQEEIKFELYLHDTRKDIQSTAQEYWSKQLRVPIEHFGTVYFKKGNIKTNRRNVSDGYHGIIRIKVKKSSQLYRRISGWLHAICSLHGEQKNC